MIDTHYKRGALLALLVLSVHWLASCATVTQGFEKPKVAVESLSLVDANGFSARFKIGLRISNPNSYPLPVSGMSYTAAINGYELISGVTNEVPEIVAYGDTQVSLEAGTNLIALTRLLSALAKQSAKDVDYTFNAKIDLQGMLPTVNLAESGKIPLQR